MFPLDTEQSFQVERNLFLFSKTTDTLDEWRGRRFRVHEERGLIKKGYKFF